MARKYNNTNTPEDERDEARTPPWLFRWLDSMYHFDVDLAAVLSNTLIPTRWYGPGNNTLERKWDGSEMRWGKTLDLFGFCNPPYSNIEPWYRKAIEEQANGFTTVFVVPALNGDARDSLVASYASKIIHIHGGYRANGKPKSGRVNFLRPDGTPMKGNNRGTDIVVFSPDRIGAPTLEWVERDWIIEHFSY